MSIKGKVYYREKTEFPTLFKQIIKVLSDPKKYDNQTMIDVKKFNIDYTGFKIEKREFGDFPDEGGNEEVG
ncbi:MAG: hypothetical protein ACOC3V_05705, partial [bacterium]